MTLEEEEKQVPMTGDGGGELPWEGGWGDKREGGGEAKEEGRKEMVRGRGGVEEDEVGRREGWWSNCQRLGLF